MAQPVFADSVILPPNSTGTKVPMFAAAITGGTVYIPGTVLTDNSANTIDTAIATLTGTERGLIMRQMGAPYDSDTLYQQMITPGRDGLVALRSWVAGDSFANGIDPGIWTTTVATGTVTAAAGVATLATTAAATASAQLVSTYVAGTRYQTGAHYLWSAGIRTDAALANNTRRWGVFTVSAATPGVPQDGYYFEFTGTGVLNAVSVKAGVATAVASTAWSRGSYTPDPTNFHTYAILYSGNLALFLIDGVTRHFLAGSGITSSRTATLDLTLALQNINAASAATNVTMDVRGTSLTRLGSGSEIDLNQQSPTTALGAANAAVAVYTNGQDGASVELDAAGTLVGTLVFEATIDGTNWFAIPGIRVSDGTRWYSWISASGAVADRFHFFGTATFTAVRCRVSAFTSGTRNARATATMQGDLVKVSAFPQRTSYVAGARLAEAAVTLKLSFAQVANTTKQWLTLHHAATAVRTVRIEYVAVFISAATAAAEGIIEMRRITAAPATGAPAITPASVDPGAPVAEVTVLALPGTAGTEAAVNSPAAHAGINFGITAAPTTNSASAPVVLWDSRAYSYSEDLVIRAGVLEGWALDIRTTGATTLTLSIEVIFTEE